MDNKKNQWKNKISECGHFKVSSNFEYTQDGTLFLL